MNTELKQIKFKMPCQDMNGTSSLPPFANLCFWHRNGDSGLSEDDELFIGYGHVPSAFPYKMQNMYTRELHEKEMNAIVLENKYLKATFLPEWGGKLMSLIDKEKGKDLLFCNPVMRPCNLAIRNAWTSGGVEWNCGMFGHNVHTCDTLFTTTTHLDDGTPVLRMYEFERIRRVIKQLDFFLPEDSKFLFARNRIINPLPDVVPMYWWSNIAVPETPDTRVIVNADSAYVADNNTSLAPIPVYKGDDVSYPINCATAADYFYNIPHKARKFEAAVDEDGYGFIHTSTYRLIGRKLFVWGQNPGGDRWQEFLTADGSQDRYIELQAGIAHTQYECMPMPPHTTWEWLEGYGAIKGDGDTVHGEWQDAKKEIATQLDKLITDEKMDEILANTKKMATSKADGELLFKGSGWGALENIMRKKKGMPLMAEHLDFGEIGDEQNDWIHLLDHGFFPEHSVDEEPSSYMLQDDWTNMMTKTTNGGIDHCNWYARMQLGMTYVASGKLNEAWEEFDKSMCLNPSCWALYGMASVKRVIGDINAAAGIMAKASKMRPNDVSFAKEAMELLISAEMYEDAVKLADNMSDEIKKNNRVKTYYIIALIKLGYIEKAETALYDGGSYILADNREGETTVTAIYLDIQEAKAKRDGRDFDRNTEPVPPEFDYRQCDASRRRPARKRAK